MITNPEVCAPSYNYNCSKSFKDDNHLFYTHCPLINFTMCGTQSNDMVLKADLDVKRFKMENLKRFTKIGPEG